MSHTLESWLAAALLLLTPAAAACESSGAAADAATDSRGPSSDAGDASTDIAPADGDVLADTTSTEPTFVDLVDHDLWQLAEGSWGQLDMPDAEIECPEGGWYVDEGLIEVDTGLCNHVTLVQPLQADVQAGEAIDVVAWHGRLAAVGVAEGHIALYLGETEVWSETLVIPHPGSFFMPTIVAGEDLPAGTPVRFHVHNHGNNTWNLVSVRRPN